MRFTTTTLSPWALAAAMLLGASSVSAAPVMLSGDAASDGWAFIGNSRQTTNPIWARDSVTNFNVYLTTFRLTAGSSFTPSAPSSGNAVGSLISGSWLAGDRIIGLGITSLSNLNSATFKVDFGGTGSFAAAPVLDGPGGVASFGAGAGNGSISSQSLQAIPNFQYKAIDTQYKNLSGTVVAAGTGVEYESALRSWALVDGSDPNAFTYNEMEWLVNYDELLRLNMPVAAIGTLSKFSMNASDIDPLNLRQRGADVSFSYALAFPDANSTVPEPGTIALAGLALLGMTLARRRKV